MKKKARKISDRKKLAIIGLGLLGTSLGMSLKKSKYCRIGWSRSEDSREKAFELGALDKICENASEAIESADITVICLPIPKIISFGLEHASVFKKNSVVTDVGSVKEIIVKKLAPALESEGVQFVGSHPMAGSEKSGASAAYANLYVGATVFLTPVEGNKESAVLAVRKLWEDAGALTVGMNCVEHDRLVAFTSHLSHIVSLALVKTVLGNDRKSAKLIHLACAGGFRDSTRTASSQPGMWREIIENNKKSVIASLDGFEKTLKEIRHYLEKGNFNSLEESFGEGRELREKWLESYIKRLKKFSDGRR